MYNYNYDSGLPGRSLETGYGRINAAKALEVTAVGIAEQPSLGGEATFTVTSPVDKEVLVRYTLGDEPQQVDMQIYNVSGQLMYTHTLGTNEEQLSIDVQDYSPGMYFARFMNKDDEMLQTMKFIKLR
jgi:hypothetical protein